jgi:hypothetical protein
VAFIKYLGHLSHPPQKELLMKYRNKMYAATALIVSIHFLSGCDISSSKTPSEKILINALTDIQNNHDGAYKFLNIKKLDGQLRKDGLHYAMDFQANIETYKCFALPRIGYGALEMIDFSKPIMTEQEVIQMKCAEQKEEIGSYLFVTMAQSRVVIFKSNIQIPFKSEATFTKKESGWQLLDLYLSPESFNK